MLTIGNLAKRTGTKVQTIRYYEQIGLMPEPGRTEGGQRRYAEAELDRLSFIRHSRQLGFSLDVIRELLDLERPPRPALPGGRRDCPATAETGGAADGTARGAAHRASKDGP